MKKNSPIIIIGFGSIGKRHYSNLFKLGYNNLTVFDPADDAFVEFDNIKRLECLGIKALRSFSAAFICNPNNLHLSKAIKCAQAGCHLFIEKPLSHNFSGIDRLDKLCKKNKLITLVGCNMRFQPCLSFIKYYLEKKKLGNIYSIAHEFGCFLPDWRPGRDYRKNYAAKHSTGGGIILDDMHEFDLLFWLNNFNQVVKTNFIFNNSGALRIETEDNCLAIFEFANKALGLVKCDYLQQSYSRNCKIVGKKGNLEWDFNENIVWLRAKNKRKKIFEAKNFDFNQTYVKEIKYFFNCIDKNKPTFNDIKTAASVLKYCVDKK